MSRTETVSAVFARRVLLALQALGGGAPTRPESGAAAVAALVERLGYVQIDSINVIDRAHHLILAARLEGFRPAHLKEAIERRRDLFEHWTHDACAIPTRWYPHWHHRFARYSKKDRAHAWWQGRFGDDADRVIRRVLSRVRREGPLRARDFIRTGDDDPAAPREPGGWWNWHPEKAALEHLWRCGRLAIAGRDRFEKIYDLAERVHPEWHVQRPSSRAEHLEWLGRSAIERLGFATEREIAAFWSAAPIAEVRTWVRRAVERGELVRVTIESAADAPRRSKTRASRGDAVDRASVGATIGVAPADWRERFEALLDARPDGVDADGAPIVALAPFDPIVRDRARALRLFAFDYRFEAFTPAPQRRYGYYVMPLLEGDRLIGRIDPKFDRDAGVLNVRGPWWEPGVRADRARRGRFEDALDRLARHVGAASWRTID